jgi:DNA-binding transcriptional ArsR family regulator
MDENSVIEALAALAQATRLAAFRILVAEGPRGMPAGTLARRLGVPHNTLSTHLGALAKAGLVVSCRQSRQVIYSAEIPAIRAVLDVLLRDCCGGDPQACLPQPRLGGMLHE